MTPLRSISHLLAMTAVVLLAACSSAPPAMSPEVRALPERVELTAVPFFAQTAFEGVPGAVAIMLSQQGVVTTPGLIAKGMHLPGQELAIEKNISSVVNEQGLLVYRLAPNLADVLEQVSAGYPVLVRSEDGVSFVSSPRYAVVVGYDRVKQRLLLRSGMYRRQVVEFDDFVESWNKLGSWAVLVQAPAQLPANVDRQRWSSAAAELEASGQKLAARNAYEALKK